MGEHPIEYWLAVLAAVGLMAGGYACLLARLLNRTCRIASDRGLQARWLLKQGPVTRREEVALRFWLRTGAGTWPAEALSLGEWTAAGALAGTTGGFVAFAFQGAAHARHLDRPHRSGSTIDPLSPLLGSASGDRLRRIGVVCATCAIATALVGALGAAFGLRAAAYTAAEIVATVVAVATGLPLAALRRFGGPEGQLARVHSLEALLSDPGSHDAVPAYALATVRRVRSRAYQLAEGIEVGRWRRVRQRWQVIGRSLDVVFDHPVALLAVPVGLALAALAILDGDEWPGKIAVVAMVLVGALLLIRALAVMRLRIKARARHFDDLHRAHLEREPGGRRERLSSRSRTDDEDGTSGQI